MLDVSIFLLNVFLQQQFYKINRLKARKNSAIVKTVTYS